MQRKRSTKTKSSSSPKNYKSNATPKASGLAATNTGSAAFKSGKQRNQLLKILDDLLKDLDEKSILFLLRQAQTLQYNLHVENLRGVQGVPNEQRKEEGIADDKNFFPVEIIEGVAGQLFVLVLNGVRKSLSLDEMRKVVKVCHDSKDRTDAADRLFSWFVNNRRDVVHDAFLGGESDPALILLYEKVLKTYTAKEN